MAKEFNNLAKIVPDPLISVKTPQSITQKINEEFPLLAVQQKGGDKKEKDDTKSSEDNK